MSRLNQLRITLFAAGMFAVATSCARPDLQPMLPGCTTDWQCESMYGQPDAMADEPPARIDAASNPAG